MSTLGNMSKEVVEKYINDQKYTETNKKPIKGLNSGLSIP
ncbi:transposase [Limosilactobacillus fermentum]|nr:transposase [Limosilactobacillus fermentum]